MVNPKSWGFCPMFSSKNFIVLGLTFKSYIHFELNFVYGVTHMKGPTSFFFFFFLHTHIQFSQHYLLKRLSFPHWMVLAPLSKILCPYMPRFVFRLPVLFHWSICIFMPVPWCFHTVTLYKFWNREVFQLCSSFSKLFDFSGSLEISYKF